MKLISRKSHTTATLFLTKESEPLHVEGKINIILSPAFYWFKVETLPVSRASAAKELAPSLFDGVVQEGNYSYMAIKREDSFWLFAYDDQLITQKLSAVGIKPSNIAHIYFAQSECVEITKPIKVSETMALISQDGIVSMVPIVYTPHTTTIESYLNHHTFSKEHVNINFFQNSFLEERYVYRLMAIFVAVIALYLANYLIVHKALKKEQLKAYALKQRYQLPTTSFELKGLKSSLEGRQKRQIKLRETIKSLLSLPLMQGEHLQKMVIKAKSAYLEIHLSEPKRAEVLTKVLQKHMKITKAKVVDNLFLLGVKYE